VTTYRINWQRCNIISAFTLVPRRVRGECITSDPINLVPVKTKFKVLFDAGAIRTHPPFSPRLDVDCANQPVSYEVMALTLTLVLHIIRNSPHRRQKRWGNENLGVGVGVGHRHPQNIVGSEEPKRRNCSPAHYYASQSLMIFPKVHTTFYRIFNVMQP
jgi:hypothetical protein